MKKLVGTNRETASTPAATAYLPRLQKQKCLRQQLLCLVGRQPQPGREHSPEVRQEQKLHKGSGTGAKEMSKTLHMGSGGRAKPDVKPQGKVKTEPRAAFSIRMPQTARAQVRGRVGVAGEAGGSKRSVTRVSCPAKKKVKAG